MKILLVHTNRNRDLAPPPAGIAYLVEPLRRDGHEVKVVDLMFSEDPAGELETAIKAFRPDVAGFSLRNIDNQDMGHTRCFLQEDKEFVETARREKITTVLGGTAFTIFPAETLAYMGADYGIAGQGERSLPLLIRSLGEGRVDDTIPGLARRDHGGVRVNPPDFRGYAGARAAWDLMDLSGYATDILSGGVVTKTGCPHRCAYCNVTSSFGDRFTFRDPADIVGEIRDLRVGRGIRNITLIDPCFNVPLDYAKDVLKAIVRAGLKPRLCTSLIPVRGHFDDELFELFNKAGGGVLSLGTETFSEKMLKSYHKPFTMDDLRAAIGLMHRHGVPYVVRALFGGPGENAETIKESMAILPELHCVTYMFSIGVRIMPGTALFETAKRERIVGDARELFAPRFYVSKDLDVAWADRYIKSKLGERGF